MSDDKTRELRFQAIHLYRSGKMSLSELKNFHRVAASALHNDYASENDLQDMLGTRERVNKLLDLTMTRDAATKIMTMRFKQKPKPIANREEMLAKWSLGYRGRVPMNRARYGTMPKHRKPPTPPRHGSSRRHYGKTTIRGFKQFNRDFDNLIHSLQRLLKDRPEQSRRVLARLNNVRKSVSVKARV